MAATNKRINRNQKAIHPASDNAFSVSHVYVFEDGGLSFWLHYGPITIYNCRIVNGDNGEFIGFPARKSEPKKRGEAAKWYNYAYAMMDDQTQIDVINMVYDQAGKDE